MKLFLKKNIWILIGVLSLVVASVVTIYDFYSREEVVVSRYHEGEPMLHREWGDLNISSSFKLTGLKIYSGGYYPSNNLVLDMSINGSYQGLRLTVAGDTPFGELTGLSYVLSAGDKLKFKFIEVPLVPGCEFTLDITLCLYKSIWLLVGILLPTLFGIYEFLRILFKKGHD